MVLSVRSRLCAMFFLEYLIKGAWFPLLGLYMGGRYLKFSANEQAWVFSAFAIASVTGMFFGGQLADRRVAPERFMAASHLVGGLAIFGLAYVKTFWPFLGLMLVHCFFYVPTYSVANAIAFAHVRDARRDFGLVRLWGSIGWVAALPALVSSSAHCSGSIARLSAKLSSNGVRFVDSCCVLLYAAAPNGSHSAQSSRFSTYERSTVYIVWFILSVCPSVCG